MAFLFVIHLLNDSILLKSNFKIVYPSFLAIFIHVLGGPYLGKCALIRPTISFLIKIEKNAPEKIILNSFHIRLLLLTVHPIHFLRITFRTNKRFIILGQPYTVLVIPHTTAFTTSHIFLFIFTTPWTEPIFFSLFYCWLCLILLRFPFSRPLSLSFPIFGASFTVTFKK